MTPIPSSLEQAPPSVAIFPSSISIHAPSHPMVTRAKAGIFKPKHFADLSQLINSPLHCALFASQDPKGYKMALKDDKWVHAMQCELNALHKNNTWTLVPRPLNQPVVGSKWLYRTKFLADGSVDHFKARLVAQGHGHTGAMLAGGAALAAAAYGAHQLSSSHGHGGHNVTHGAHNMIPTMGHHMGGTHSGGKFKGGKHGKHGGGKFKGGKHGKFGKHGKGKGKFSGGFKKWK
ncbi:hypothetical protein E3N88_14103 [Mikania micrantha]|uniref:Reverse transcriptase Ty1/copia-type domain-containing protein n=1 Tax=Mikania micrantha TaxID=192012 RepID=A0A5N6P2J4_9ASTR|nr:hypothetical protein E3N88_14103 [Mikania micrantha]